MGIRQYIGLSIIFLIIIGIYTYSVVPAENSSYMLTFMGRSWDLPIAVWLIIPAVVLFLASVAHMLFYSIKNFLSKRLTKKDFDTLITEIKHTLLGEEKNLEYKTEPFKVLAAAVKKMTYNPQSSDEKIGENSLDEIFEILEKVRDGKYVDLKKFRLRSDNELLNKNRLNFSADDKKSVAEILKHCPSLEGEVCSKAYNALLGKAMYSDIKNYNFPISQESMLKLLARHADKKDKFKLSTEEIEQLLKSTELNVDGFLGSAKILKKAIDPDTIVKIYDSLQQKDNHASCAYLYILFELRLMEKAREFLDASEESEFEKFKILLFLRDNGKVVDTDLIV